MSKPPIFDQASLHKIAQANAAQHEATALIPTVIPTEKGDQLVRSGVPLEDAHILAGDWLAVRPSETAEDGKVVIAYKDGAYTVTRAPARDGAEIKALVIGVLRRLA